MSLAAALERAAEALPDDADAIRPANGDPHRLLRALPGEAAVRVLGWLLAEAPEEAEELVESWELEDEAGVPALLAVNEEALPKAGRRCLRRVRHRLRSRGVATPEPAPRAVVAALPALRDEFAAALVTAPDPAGVRLAHLVESDPSGGGRLFEILLDDARGVLDLNVYQAGRSKIRAFLRAAASRAGIATVEAPPDAVRALVARVATRQAPDRRPVAELSEWRSHVADAPPGTLPPEAMVAAALGEDPAPERLAEAAQRVRAGEFGPWPPPAERLRPAAERIRERAQSPVLVSGAQRREQAEAALDEALDDLFAGDAAAAAADRFRATAYVSWKRGDEETARLCLSAAAAFGKLPASGNPVARALIESALAPLFAALEQEEPPSLIAKP